MTERVLRDGASGSPFPAAAAALPLPAGTSAAPRPPGTPPPSAQAARAPGSGEAPARGDGLEHAASVADYTLRATLDPSTHGLHGEGEIRFRNTSAQPLHELYFHLYLNAFKNERTVFMRTPLRGFRGGGTLDDWGYVAVRRLAVRETGADLWAGAERTTPGDPEDETDLRVPLPTALAPGASLTLEVAWDAHLPRVLLRTGHYGSFHLVGQWFPKLARLEPDGRWAHFPFEHLSEFYADFGRYDVTIDTPANVVVGATGHLEEDRREGARALRRYVQEDVHDFAFAAWDGFLEKTATHDGVALRCLYPEGHERDADVELDTAAYGLSYLGAAYGKYPYRTLTIVHPPDGAEEAGGMEYPTLITTGGAWYYPYTGVRIEDVVTIHELGHQWFYGLVATDEHTWPFLDEGLNTYAEGDALEARYPGASLGSVLGVTASLPAVYRVPASDAAHDAPIAQPAAAFATGTDYAALVYSRTGTVLWTLGRVYGEAAVRQTLGVYTRRFRFQHPGPRELLAVVAERLGDDAAEVLRVALFERGWVDFMIDDLASEPAGAAAGLFGEPLEGAATAPRPRGPVPQQPGVDGAPGAPPPLGGSAAYRGYVIVRRLGTLQLPVEVELTGADGTVQRVPWDGRAAVTRLAYLGASPLASAVVDPEHRVLLDQDLTNNARSAAPATVAGRALERLTFGAGVGLSLVAP